MRSDNLRAAPGFFTPDLVRRVLEQIEKPMVLDAAGVPVVKMPQPKPTLHVVEAETGAENQTEPKCMANPPVEHARRAEEEEAAAPASPPRGGRWAGHTALHRQAEFHELVAIAHRRGIALHDLALAIGKPKPTVASACEQLGVKFSFRPPLADPLTKERLLALADDNIPLPELRRDRLRAQALERRALAERERRAAAKQAQICEATHRTPRHDVRSAAPREPAPGAPQRTVSQTVRPANPPQQARAHPLTDREAYERRTARTASAIRRGIEQKAAALLDGDESQRSRGGAINSVLAAAVVQLKERRAAEERHNCPIEQAKTVLRRRFAPVCSMAVHGGDPTLFQIGHRKDVTREEMLELAAKVAA